jgi:small-conductance mechanosensitive channel
MHIPYPIGTIGTAITLAGAFLVSYASKLIFRASIKDARREYQYRNTLTTLVAVAAAVIVVLLWARLLQQRGTFLGLIGAGLTVALKEPLLAIAGRLTILAGGYYSVGDRVQVAKIAGDVIDVGFFYTRMMELGNWIGGDQATGRIVQFSNSKLFGENPVYNYTRNFSYIWDEIQLPITYASDMKAARQILLDVGGQYSEEFMQGAQQEVERMQHYFLVPNFELKPQVYVEVTSNWMALTLRYLVQPKKRRQAKSFIYVQVFERVQGRKDIMIASETMDLAIHESQPTASTTKADQEPGKAA